ncbi:hypothetical protein [Aminobacterium sp. UBA5514]|uniref:MuF-C-terminal domain-containing protein n=1 Tax=Aminobacterium sp. UBA5514 TaxID=1946036 RepID=UPI00257D27D5|nr:hypothetical protein [Aminobacterium sp. UBA5514]
MTQALVAGVDADVAKVNASLFEARAKDLLGRYGTNPREWYDRIGLQIDEGSLGIDSDGVSYNQDGAINLNDNFYKWFGDSKVVDEEGKPLIVYHTGTMDDSYDIAKSRSYNGSPDYEIPGIYLTADKQESQDYGSSGQTKELYVSIKNPYNEDTTALHDRLGTWRKVMDYLIEQGYDGVIDDESGEIIAFSPNQIKSVYNEGTWSSESDNIYNQQEASLARDEAAFSKSVDEFLEGKFNKRSVIPVMTTPLALKLAGAEVLPVHMSESVLKKVIEKHQLSPEAIKSIPRAMADPVMIFRSETAPGRLVVMLDIRDARKGSLIIPLALNAPTSGRGKYEVNLVTSAYYRTKRSGEPQDNWFIDQIEKGNLAYINTKKSSRWNALSGQTFPDGTNLPTWTRTGNFLDLKIPTEADLVKLKQQFPCRWANVSFHLLLLLVCVFDFPKNYY